MINKLEIVRYMHEIQLVEPGPTKRFPLCHVIFYGPDREANARKFMHLDELVKWAVEFVALEDNALKEWANESFIPWTGNEPCMVRLRALKTILAKIEGKP